MTPSPDRAPWREGAFSDIIAKALYKLWSNQWGVPGTSGRQLYQSLGPNPAARLIELALQHRAAYSRELSAALALRGMPEEDAYAYGRWKSKKQFRAYVRRLRLHTLPQPVRGAERHSRQDP